MLEHCNVLLLTLIWCEKFAALAIFHIYVFLLYWLNVKLTIDFIDTRIIAEGCSLWLQWWGPLEPVFFCFMAEKKVWQKKIYGDKIISGS